MTGHEPRRLFTGDRKRKLLVIVDESPEGDAALYFAARRDSGPGPLVSSLAAGAKAGTFPIPVTIVPGNLTIEEIAGLA